MVSGTSVIHNGVKQGNAYRHFFSTPFSHKIFGSFK
jgi:hypothetical protein